MVLTTLQFDLTSSCMVSISHSRRPARAGPYRTEDILVLARQQDMKSYRARRQTVTIPSEKEELYSHDPPRIGDQERPLAISSNTASWSFFRKPLRVVDTPVSCTATPGVARTNPCQCGSRVMPDRPWRRAMNKSDYQSGPLRVVWWASRCSRTH